MILQCHVIIKINPPNVFFKEFSTIYDLVYQNGYDKILKNKLYMVKY